MNWRNVRLIASREVQDQLRDRRTLFMVLVLPLVLYPALAIGMLQMQTFFVEQTRTVVVLGADHLPKQESYELIDAAKEKFHPGWFSSPLNVDKLRVVSDLPAEAGVKPPEEKVNRHVQLIVNAKEIRKKVERRAAIQRDLGLVDTGGSTVPRSNDDDPRTAELVAEFDLLNKELGRLFAESEIQVLIVIPEGFAEHLAAVNERLEKRGDPAAQPGPNGDPLANAPQPLIVRNSADEKSRIAFGRVKEALDEWKAHIIRDRLDRANLPSSLTDVDTENVEIAGNEEFTANIWGKLFPALLVVMCVTGAFHPAVDLAAGEKERGTMETLLICPASRTEIVIGKFLTIMLFSITTAMLNIVSMGITAAYIISMKGDSDGPAGAFANLGFPGLDAIAWVVVLSLPLAALFSALCLALSTFARSVKEGQYYLTPLLMVTLGLTVFCMSPGAEIKSYTSVMPVVGPALLLKELLVTSGSTSALMFVPAVLLTSIGYSALALWWAIDQFQREDVLFREAERFELRLWWRHLMRDKESTPSFAEAGFCFALIMFLQFAAIPFFQNYFRNAGGSMAEKNIQLQMIQQLVVIATPALIMGVMLTTDPLRTFRLRWPSWRFLGVALALAIVLRPLAFAMVHGLGGWFFEPLPEWVQQQLKLLMDVELPLWLVLLAIAVVPGICEEIAFRGFILSGFARSGRTWLAIGMSSLAFGLAHGLSQQGFHAVLLGLVLGLIAVRSGSLLPCILFHMASNGLTVLIAEAHGGRVRLPGFEYLITSNGPEDFEFRWPVLVVCGIAAYVMIRWLIRLPNAPERPSSITFEPPPEVEGAPLPREPVSVG